MPDTARDFINLALKEAGVLGVGQTALAEDINDSFTILRRMLAQWQKKRWLVPALIQSSMIWNGQKSNTIGTGGFFNIPRPAKISAAWIVQLNTGSTPVSLPLDPLFSYEDYARVSVKDLLSLGKRFFYDAAFPLGNLFVLPIPDANYQVYIVIEQQLGWPTDLNQIFNLPEEYEEAIHYNLAIRLASAYKKVIQPNTAMLAKASLNTIRVANTQVPRLSMPSSISGGKAFNIFNADGN